MNPKLAEIDSLYSAGKLAEAVTAALNLVKSEPTNVGARLFLAELFCFQGDWERAERQLEAVAKQSQDDGFFAMLVRQLIRGEILREQVFAEGRPPELVGELPKAATIQLEVCAALRAGQAAEAADLVEQAASVRVPSPLVFNGKNVDDFRDLDDRIAEVLEVITTTGKYYWVPWASLRQLEFSKPERPLDLIWRKAVIDVKNGPEGEVFIPVRYPGPTGEGWDDQLRLGRATSWHGGESSVVTGLGQKMYLVGDEAQSAMDIDSIHAMDS